MADYIVDRCDSCKWFCEDSKHCSNSHATKWGNVSMSTACMLFIPKQKCDDCDKLNVASQGCDDRRSGRWGVVIGQPRCSFFVPLRAGDKKGGFLTNLESEEE